MRERETEREKENVLITSNMYVHEKETEGVHVDHFDHICTLYGKQITGHCFCCVQNALNIYTREVLIEEYLKNPRKTQDPNKRFILIFHCEFSSERGPSL